MCLNPTIIFNKDASDLLLRVHQYFNPVVNSFVNCWTFCNYWLATGNVYLSPRKLRANKENFKDFFVLDETGEAVPLFIQVPCNKCLLCKNKKTIDFSTRCLMEAATSPTAPYFITLTYNNEYLPADNQPSKDECQRFLKRLRKQLPYPIRYVLVSEFGTNKGRVHYHALLFGVHDKPSDFLDILKRCWTLGFVYSVRVSATSEKSFTRSLADSINYVAKYLIIGQQVGTFMLCSRGRGDISGIGSEYTLKIKDHHRKYPKLTTLKINLFGEVIERPMPSYVKDKIFPSASRLIPVSLKAVLKDLDRTRETLFHLYRHLNPTSLRNPFCTCPLYISTLFSKYFRFKYFSSQVKYEIDYDAQFAINRNDVKFFYAFHAKHYLHILETIALLDLIDFFDNADNILHARTIYKKVVQDYAISHPNDIIGEEKYRALQKKLSKSLLSRKL